MSQLENMRKLGVTGKKWVCGPEGAKPPVCDMCRANAAAGAIPIDQPFPSGHMEWPAHDGCRCAIAPVMLEEK